MRIDHASLWLLALDSRSHALPFPDAAEGQLYSEAVRWAWLDGAMTGYGDGTGLFGTEASLSRAEMATVLWRLAGEPEADADLSAFADASDASGYALAALRWAVSEGVLRGTGEGLLEPGRAVTRAEMAAILMRLVTVS